jgi:predicted enzyme related to lactoylglutathione lyase
MDVLGSRTLVRASNLIRSHRFYRDQLGLAISREFGPPDSPGVVYHAGNGLIEVSGHAEAPTHDGVALWLQVRDVEVEHTRLREAGVTITRPPRQEPWGLIEMWLNDPDGLPIVIVEVPADHPLRRDQR